MFFGPARGYSYLVGVGWVLGNYLILKVPQVILQAILVENHKNHHMASLSCVVFVHHMPEGRRKAHNFPFW